MSLCMIADKVLFIASRLTTDLRIRILYAFIPPCIIIPNCHFLLSRPSPSQSKIDDHWDKLYK